MNGKITPVNGIISYYGDFQKGSKEFREKIATYARI